MAEIYLPHWTMELLRERLNESESSSALAPPPQITSTYTLSPLTWQETFTPKHYDAVYHVAELLQFHDEAFIQAAYQALLRRPPDAEGQAGFLKALREGRLNRLDVLARIRFSPEGVRQNVTIHGLRGPAILRRAYRLPLLGPLLRWSVAVARLPRLVRHVTQLEAHWAAQQEAFAGYVNRLNTEHGQHLQQQAATLQEVAAQVSALQQEDRAAQAHEVSLTLQQMSEAWHGALARLSATQHEHLTDQQRQVRTQSAMLRQIDALAQQVEMLEQKLQESYAAYEAQRQNWQADRRAMAGELAQQRTALAAATTRQRDLTRLQQTLAQNLARQVVAQDHDRQRVQQQTQDWTQRLEQVAQDWAQHLDRTAQAWDARWNNLTAQESPERLEDFYIALEDGLRGSRAMISQRLRVYLPLLSDNGLGAAEKSVLDVGCGRGEWLELLREEGFTAQGVDVNEIQAAHCRELGLEVIAADALTYLRGLPDASFGVVTCFHVVEHLPLDKLLALIHEMHRVLQPGGLLLCETPNPRNVLVGTCNFYYDPTHRNPLPSPVLQIMLEHQGLERVQVLELNPSDAQPVAGEGDLTRRFNEYFYGPMDYAALGWKRSEQPTVGSQQPAVGGKQ